VSLKGILIDLNRRHKRELLARRDAAALLDSDGRIARDSLLELSSVDKIVAFYDDRLESRTRLGDVHRVIPYDTIHAVILKKPRAASLSVGERSVFEASSGREAKMVLRLESRRQPVVFDFRSEPKQRVHEALEIVQRRLRRSVSQANFDGDAPSFLSALQLGRADEITKLAALKDAGILTAEEFETEKARILNS
jgi:hypothetical protein